MYTKQVGKLGSVFHNLDHESMSETRECSSVKECIGTNKLVILISREDYFPVYCYIQLSQLMELSRSQASPFDWLTELVYNSVKCTGSQKELIPLQDAVHIEALLWDDVYPWQVCSGPTQTGPAQDNVHCNVLQ